MIGQTVSHYRIDRRLGEGGMGLLYRAEDTRLGRLVALKFLRDEVARDDHAIDRFRRKARAASALNNPHICTIHDVGVHDGQHFIVMELLEGSTLGERLKEGPLAPGELLDLAGQIAEALVAAHGKGIVHRDLKPSNAFVTSAGLLKVMDFGIAKLQRETTGHTTSVHGLRAALLVDDDRSSTPTGTVVGTLSYMSPEQIRGHEIDPRSDIFSFGALLFEMATGMVAFPGGSARETMEAVSTHVPLPPSRYRRDLPRGFDHVVLTALAKVPAARYQSAADMLSALRSLPTDGRPSALDVGFTGNWLRPGRSLLASVSRLWNPPPEPVERGEQTRRIGSLAVLPLLALNRGEHDAILAAGITDALIGLLTQIRAMRVISRTSVIHYAETRKRLPQIARELGVDALVEGSVLVSGTRVRVTARLIEAAQERSVWSGTFDRDLRELLTLQSDLAQALAGEIRVALTPEEEGRLDRRRPVDPAVHLSYLRGRFLMNRGGPQEVEHALRELQIAIRGDPTFTPAWAATARAYAILGGATYAAMPPRQVMPLARTAAQQALELEPSAEAHAALAYVAERYDFDFGRAREHFDRALELDPGSAVARESFGSHLCNMGHFDQAIAEVATALSLDPFSMTTHLGFVWYNYLGRRYAEAAGLARQMLALEPAFAHSRFLLAMSLFETGNTGEAAREIEAFLAQRPDDPLAQAAVGYARARLGDTARALAVLQSLLDLRQTRYVAAERIGFVHLGLGDIAACLDWLETAYEERSAGLTTLGVHPAADALRGEPRFRDLMCRVGLPAS